MADNICTLQAVHVWEDGDVSSINIPVTTYDDGLVGAYITTDRGSDLISIAAPEHARELARQLIVAADIMEKLNAKDV